MNRPLKGKREGYSREVETQRRDVPEGANIQRCDVRTQHHDIFRGIHFCFATNVETLRRSNVLERFKTWILAKYF